jgi:hypothetical protein
MDLQIRYYLDPWFPTEYTIVPSSPYLMSVKVTIIM